MRRGGFQTRPYVYVVQDENAMDMVWHDHEFISSDVGIVLDEIIPALPHDLSVRVETHFPVDHISKETLPLVGDNSDKVPAWLGIVIAGQTQGFATMLWDLHDNVPDSSRGGFQTRPYDRLSHTVSLLMSIVKALLF